MTDSDPSGAYVALRPCGCVVMACANNPEHKKDVARAVAKCIRDGFRIEQRSVEATRVSKFSCDVCKTFKEKD